MALTTRMEQTKYQLPWSTEIWAQKPHRDNPTRLAPNSNMPSN